GGFAADGQRPRGIADESDERRRVDRAQAHAARHPAPLLAEHGPAPVVRRDERPRRFVDPRPAPGRNPFPAAVAVRRPAVLDVLRIPDDAVVLVLLPLARAVQRLVAHDFARHVARGHRLVLATVAFGGPAVEVVLRRLLVRIDLCERAALEDDLLAAAHGQRLALLTVD